MAIGSFPGVDTKGFRDPTAGCLAVFADSTARDAWVTAQGGIANIPSGFTCYLSGTHVLCVNEAGTWKSTVALT